MSVVNNSTDQLNSVAAAMQSIATNAPSAATPRRTSDLIPTNWEGSVEPGEVIFLMEALCLWMQVWSDQGEKMQVRVECIEKIDTDSLSVDCSVTQCRGIETAMRKTPKERREMNR